MHYKDIMDEVKVNQSLFIIATPREKKDLSTSHGIKEISESKYIPSKYT